MSDSVKSHSDRRQHYSQFFIPSSLTGLSIPILALTCSGRSILTHCRGGLGCVTCFHQQNVSRCAQMSRSFKCDCRSSLPSLSRTSSLERGCSLNGGPRMGRHGVSQAAIHLQPGTEASATCSPQLRGQETNVCYFEPLRFGVACFPAKAD